MNASFNPAPNQRRWVRDRQAAIWFSGQWIHFDRVDQRMERMVDPPYDHNDVGVWQDYVISVWRCSIMGREVEFSNIRQAEQYLELIRRW